MSWIEVESRGRRCRINPNRIVALQELEPGAVEVYLVGLPETIIARESLESFTDKLSQLPNNSQSTRAIRDS